MDLKLVKEIKKAGCRALTNSASGRGATAQGLRTNPYGIGGELRTRDRRLLRWQEKKKKAVDKETASSRGQKNQISGRAGMTTNESIDRRSRQGRRESKKVRDRDLTQLV